ncbi:protein lin-37 homolog [Agrilus planipennis]|uniref:Protein lin-37 homolog n=1 Tax=Agrilus planipennis TaxID=224129 RepID=A0A7F5R8M3_AGRPL|nr:protein lin-37 homolog [Agrilus planipennis]
MTKKRKLESSNQVKVEVKEENSDYLTAKVRLKGVLKQLTENEKSESDSSDDDNKGYRSHKKYDNKNKNELSQGTFRSTYVMKLFDRSVDLARFEEDTPLYPICRAWMANQPRNPNPQVVVKRRYSSPEPDSHLHLWNGHDIRDITVLPKPLTPFTSRVPSPLPEQKNQDKAEVNLNYNEKPPLSKDTLIRNHLQRWVNVKKKWIGTALKNEDRYKESMKILQTIYNKAQESME